MDHIFFPHRLVARLRRRKLFYRSFVLSCILVILTAPALYAQSCPLYPSPHQRIGFNMTLEGGVAITDYDVARLGAGWYHDYTMRTNPAQPGGTVYHQMVRAANRTTPAQIQQLLTQLGPRVDAMPGALWILGNEPDRYGQDGVTAAQYVRFYHDVYYFIRGRDPQSRIAIAGIVQPTPIRFRYLDLILTTYQQQYGVAMPVDIWDIHNFILPENCGWGASIPPGLEAYRSEAIPCPPTLDDHGDLEIFEQQIRTFRQWMKDRGYQDRPLIVSEYGILLSKYHGYTYERVRDFMVGTFDFMLNTKDSATGYPADDHRLVQEFAWFSLNYYEFNINTYFGLNGNLFDHDSRQIMPLGLDYADYTNNVTLPTIDLAFRTLQATPNHVKSGETVSLQVNFVNQGGVAAKDVAVRFWAGDPREQGQLLGTSPLVPQVLSGCHQQQGSAFTWLPTQSGNYTIFADFTATNLGQDSDSSNNYVSLAVSVNGNGTATATPTPSLTPTATPTIVPSAPTATPTIVPSAPTATPTNVPSAPATTPTPTATATVVLTTQASATPTPTITGTPTPPAAQKHFFYFPVVVQ